MQQRSCMRQALGENLIQFKAVLLIGLLLLSGCDQASATKTVLAPTPSSGAEVPASITQIPTMPALQPTEGSENIFSIDIAHGSDSNSGVPGKPWRTIERAVSSLKAGDTAYVRGGEYPTILNGWSFVNSGTEARPIKLTNYPGEQVVIKLAGAQYEYMAFRCRSTTTDPASWQTPKADYIQLIGTNVSPRLLSNGVQSRKGIVIQGSVGEQADGVVAAGCDHWEVAGMDFVEVAVGVFAKNSAASEMDDNSADKWYVHDNRVYNYYRESGLQFNGDENRIENNEIYKVSDELYTPYGCQLLNILGRGNTIRGNTLSRQGSRARCGGILLEWDRADFNILEQNRVADVAWGIEVAGGDNNIARNNLIYSADGDNGIKILSYDGRSAWPCNDAPDSNHSDKYDGWDCHSSGNHIYNNTVYGFEHGVGIYEVAAEGTVIRNNAFAQWNTSPMCYANTNEGSCQPLPETIVADHNATREPFGFLDAIQLDFHLTLGSPLIDTGYLLDGLNPNDYDGKPRPQGSAYDIGAYEYASSP